VFDIARKLTADILALAMKPLVRGRIDQFGVARDDYLASQLPQTPLGVKAKLDILRSRPALESLRDIAGHAHGRACHLIDEAPVGLQWFLSARTIDALHEQSRLLPHRKVLKSLNARSSSRQGQYS
jgi:hypothetical protein